MKAHKSCLPHARRAGCDCGRGLCAHLPLPDPRGGGALGAHKLAAVVTAAPCARVAWLDRPKHQFPPLLPHAQGWRGKSGRLAPAQTVCAARRGGPKRAPECPRGGAPDLPLMRGLLARRSARPRLRSDLPIMRGPLDGTNARVPFACALPLKRWPLGSGQAKLRPKAALRRS